MSPGLVVPYVLQLNPLATFHRTFSRVAGFIHKKAGHAECEKDWNVGTLGNQTG